MTFLMSFYFILFDIYQSSKQQIHIKKNIKKRKKERKKKEKKTKYQQSNKTFMVSLKLHLFHEVFLFIHLHHTRETNDDERCTFFFQITELRKEKPNNIKCL